MWNRYPLMVVFGLLAVASAAAEIPESQPKDSIPSYQVVRPGLATAGQPSEDALGKLKALGFKTVINLRPPSEHAIVEKEEKIVTAQGLRYVSVPVTPETFSARDVDAVRRVLDDPEAGPVLFHCASANRVGAVWAVLEVDRGKSLAEAEAEGRKIGLRSEPMVQALHRVVEAGGSKRGQ
jgi:uncharacterized protein (TIGR01244 family)